MADELGPFVELLGHLRGDIQSLNTNLSGRIDTLTTQMAQMGVDHAQRITGAEKDIDHLKSRVTTVENVQGRHAKSIGELYDRETADEGATKALAKDQERRQAWRDRKVQLVTALLLILATAGWLHGVHL